MSLLANRLFALLFLIVSLSSCIRPGEKPNIILIVADDLGWKDVGFMGSQYYETPNLDRLASEGMIFLQAYAGAANCAPSRACLLSGMNTPVHGIYTVNSSERGSVKTRQLIPIVNIDTLHNDFITMAEMLKGAGYSTCSIGKWHLGENPCSQGFDINIGGGLWGHPTSYFSPYQHPDLEAPADEYLTDRLSKEAINYIRTAGDGPFFLYLPYYAVHTPLQSKPEFEKKYINMGGTGCQTNATYAGMIDNLDRCIGLILNELIILGIEENTLVIFTSDNGGIRRISCQDPLRAGKGSYYEGGILVPMAVKWPGKIKPGSISNRPVVNMDIYPTLMELIDLEPQNSGLDGVSLFPQLSGIEVLDERTLFWHFPIYLQAYKPGYDEGRDPLFRTRPGSVIRKGNWKLHYYYEDNGIELYNLEEDIGERVNLADLESEKREELLKLLKSWLESNGAPIPEERNPLFDKEFELSQITRVMAMD